MSSGRKMFGKTREYMWYEQGGLCFFCGIEMVWRDFSPQDKMNPNDATIDHLDERSHPNRGRFSNMRRRVLSCHECNKKRGHEFSDNAGTYRWLTYFEEFKTNNILTSPID